MIDLPSNVQWVGDIGVFVVEGDEASRCRIPCPGQSRFCQLPLGHEGRHETAWHDRPRAMLTWSGDSYPVNDAPGWPRLAFVAPEAWAQYDKPCETLIWLEGPNRKVAAPNPDCRDGHQVWEVRWPYDHQDYGPGTVEARATIEVVPVVYMGRFDTGERPCVMIENASTTAAWYVPSKDGKRPFALDPRPRPGRDFVVVVRKVAS